MPEVRNFTKEDYESLGIDESTLKLIASTQPADVPNSTLFELCYTAVKYGLDPIRKEVILMPKKTKASDGSYQTSYQIMVTIDGMRKVAEDTGNYSPGRSSEFHYDEQSNLVSCTAFVMKYHEKSGTWHEVPGTAFYEEYVQMTFDKDTRQMRPNHMWEKMKHSQTEKCAEARALRRAFPVCAKLYIAEENVPLSVDTPEQVPPSIPDAILNSVRDRLEKS